MKQFGKSCLDKLRAAIDQEYLLRAATADEIHPASLKMFPLDPGSPIGANDEIRLVFYFSGGCVARVPLSGGREAYVLLKTKPKPRHFGKREWRFAGPMLAMMVIAAAGLIYTGWAGYTARLGCAARGGVSAYVWGDTHARCIRPPIQVSQ